MLLLISQAGRQVVDMAKLRTRSQYQVLQASSNIVIRGLHWLSASLLLFYTCEE